MDSLSLNTQKTTRVLILGGSGMLGHKLWLVFKNRFDTFVTLRQPISEFKTLNFFDPERTFDKIDFTNAKSLMPVLEKTKPDILINCVGIVKQISAAKDPITSILINSLLPHQLEKTAKLCDAKLIHISTDCIFEGNKGNYSEEDTTQTEDLYGLTKLLGEVSNTPSLTLRTSIIGRELSRYSGLLEWFLGRKVGEQVNGYTHAIFSGFTTTALAETLAWILEKHRNLSGIYHLSSLPISKYELLKKLQKAFHLDIDVASFDNFHCDRSLNGNRFNKGTGFVPPSWDAMIEGLIKEDSFYKELKNAVRR